MNKLKNASNHWADHAANILIQKNAGKEKFVCAAGISPSGTVHIGNFREVITVDFIVRALRDRGKEVRFIFSWDEYDALRKVPKNLPNQEMVTENLRRPLADVPDPFGEMDSYAAHFEKKFEAELHQVGIEPECLYQAKNYREGRYSKGVRHALKNLPAIVEILNSARTSPLPKDWTPLAIYCTECGKDTTTLRSLESMKYTCECSPDVERDVSLEAPCNAKLVWRVDWPMRWNAEQVDFEPGGKDHSSTGGSFDTGKQIIKKVWDQNPPYYVQYDFVLLKGLGAKFSSSTGTTLTVGDALKVYEPSIIRWIFAHRKPNMDFSLSFDLDVLKAYDDFDRTERFAYGVEPGEEKKVSYEARIYDFCRIPADASELPKEMPAQFPFRHLCNILQIHEGNLEKAKAPYQDLIKTPEDEKRFHSRSERAWFWIENHAPEEFKFSLRGENSPPSPTCYPKAVEEVVTALNTLPETISEDDLAKSVFDIMKANELKAKEFFGELYRILIDKPQGPKLAPFLKSIGLKRSGKILGRALG